MVTANQLRSFSYQYCNLSFISGVRDKRKNVSLLLKGIIYNKFLLFLFVFINNREKLGGGGGYTFCKSMRRTTIVFDEAVLLKHLDFVFDEGYP